LECKIADHLEVLSIRNEREPLHDSRRRDQCIKSPQPVRFGVPLEQIVREPGNLCPQIRMDRNRPKQAIDSGGVG
jgi:hypothetical protein